MEVKTEHTIGKELRRKAAIFWILSGVLIAGAIGSILLYRNPWMVHRVDASQVNLELLEQIADSRSPYIKIDGMTMTFTGYYKVNHSGEVCAYCYIGALGDDYILADIPASDQGALLEEESEENMLLKNYTLEGQIVSSDVMAERLAEGEEMALDTYKDYYHVMDLEIHGYSSDQERIRIYQIMLIFLGVGAAAAGFIILSEARITERETEDIAY